MSDPMHGESGWWESFFRGPWEALQLGGYPEERTRSEAAFALSALQIQPGSRILDVPCGEGRHSIEFARQGHRPTGLDFNPAAIAIARERANAKAVQAEFVVADMRELDAAAEYDAAVCFFGSFGYFSDDDNLRFASNVARALRPGASFLIDSHVAESLLPSFRERDWFWVRQPSPLRVLEERRFDMDTGRIEVTWTFIRDASVVSSTSSIRLYTYRELCELLRKAGFSRFQAYETGKLEPFRVGSSRLTIVAQR